MSNFTDFFPAAGGGGFTKMNKYSTNRAFDDATHKLKLSNIDLRNVGTISAGSTSGTLKLNENDAAKIAITSAVNGLVGYTFDIGNGDGVQTVTANTGGAYQVNQTVSFTPAVSGDTGNNTTFNMLASPSFTVNPATDLGLSDGDSLGYFMVSSGMQLNDTNQGGEGGKIIYGTSIITNASTDLVLTPGVANLTYGEFVHSTISGGLTLTTGSGANNNGYGARSATYQVVPSGQGILGYGVGGATNTRSRPYGSGSYPSIHGWGSGGKQNTVGGDGAILLYY